MFPLVKAELTDGQFADIQAQWGSCNHEGLQRDKIHPVDSKAFLDIHLPACNLTQEARQARACLGMLISGDALSSSINDLLLPALTCPSKKLLGAIQDDLQVHLDAFYRALEERQYQDGGVLSEDIKIWAMCRLNNMLSYAAYFEYEDGARISLPVFVDQVVRKVSYRFKRMPITIPLLNSPYCAYGLEATDDKSAPSQLLLMGTTYPGSSGFLWSLLADTLPLTSVGRLIYFLGEKTLNRWIEAQENAVLCHGQSLGGSLAIMVAKQHPKVYSYALAPAGCYGPQKDGSNVTVIYAGSDHISLVGNLPEKATFIYIVPPTCHRNEPKDRHIAQKPMLKGAIASHALGLSGHKGAQLFQVDDGHMLKNHKHRQLMQVLHAASWVVVFPIIALAFVVAAILRPILLLGLYILSILDTCFKKSAAACKMHSRRENKPDFSDMPWTAEAPEKAVEANINLENHQTYTPQNRLYSSRSGTYAPSLFVNFDSCPIFKV